MCRVRVKLAIIFFCLLFWPSITLAKDNSYGAIILLDEVKNSFDAQGREVWYEHELIQVLNQKGIQEFGEVVIPFSTKYQRLKVLKAVTILPNGQRVKPTKDAYNVVSPPFVMQAPIYSDIKYQTISMPALCPGAVIEYAYELRTIKSYMPGQFWAKNIFQQEYPVKRAIYALSVPKSKIPKIILKHIHLRPKKEVRGDQITFIWEVQNLPAIDAEPYAPPLEELAASIALSTVPSWDKVARWYYDLAKDALKPDIAIKKKAKELTKDCKDEWAKIKAIYNYVAQNIRYVGVEFGINGYKPHPASQIFRLRYGDCKDHSTLLIAMLRSVGIKAYAVLIPTTEIANLNERLPMPGAFDHEITAVLVHGKYIFLDSTAESTPCGQLPPSDQGRRVLLVKDGRAVLVATPVFGPKVNQEIYKARFWLDAEGVLKGTGKLVYTGVYAMFRREQFIHMTAQQRQRTIEKIINNFSPGARLLGMEISPYQDLNQPNVRVGFRIKDDTYATKTAHLLSFHAPLPSFSHLISLVAAAKRHYPYRLGYCLRKVAEVEIHLPQGYRCIFLPEDYRYTNNVGRLEIRWRKKGDVIICHEVLEVNQAEIPVDKYAQLRHLFTLAVKLNRNQVIILKKTLLAKRVKGPVQEALRSPLTAHQRQECGQRDECAVL